MHYNCILHMGVADVLACEHEEALHAATEALKSLIHACIDLNLIKQGVNQITTNADMETRRSRPTIIEKLCATIESLLDYRFSTVWDMSFQVISTLFNKLGNIMVVSPFFPLFLWHCLG